MVETQRTVHLARGPSSDQGTFGILTTDKGTQYHTGELPWRDNQHGVSCIPSGTYRCALYDSPKRGLVFMVHDVPDRDDIELHAGNWCGDKSIGYRSDVNGCILLGTEAGTLSGQRAVLYSRAAVQAFMDEMGPDDFRLIIE